MNFKNIVPDKYRNVLGRFKAKHIYLPDKHKYIAEEAQKRKSVLICGFPKSGNTWTRFVIFNYYNIKFNKSKETLTYEELNALQCNKIECKMGDNHSLIDETEMNGYSLPYFVRTHNIYSKVFKSFDHIIYIYRNPMDCLISKYYKNFYSKNNNISIDINEYVLSNLHVWVNHYKTTYYKSDLCLSYEKRKEDPFFEHKRLMSLIDEDICEDSLIKSIELSSFDNIKKMGERTGQKKGMHEGEKDPVFNFARSGQSRQYSHELNKDTIRDCKSYLIKNNITDYMY